MYETWRSVKSLSVAGTVDMNAMVYYVIRKALKVIIELLSAISPNVSASPYPSNAVPRELKCRLVIKWCVLHLIVALQG